MDNEKIILSMISDIDDAMTVISIEEILSASPFIEIVIGEDNNEEE